MWIHILLNYRIMCETFKVCRFIQSYIKTDVLYSKNRWECGRAQKMGKRGGKPHHTAECNFRVIMVEVWSKMQSNTKTVKNGAMQSRLSQESRFRSHYYYSLHLVDTRSPVISARKRRHSHSFLPPLSFHVFPSLCKIESEADVG